jgi:hypothetical protein
MLVARFDSTVSVLLADFKKRVRHRSVHVSQLKKHISGDKAS